MDNNIEIIPKAYCRSKQLKNVHIIYKELSQY